jgi:hypothetical protein
MWGTIIEKAFAKFNGNYARIEGGNVTNGISALNGSPYDTYYHWTEYNSSASEYDLW